jgi:hypothetical protein
VHQPGQCQLGDIDEHECDKNFIGVESGPQEGRDSGPSHPAKHTSQQHERHCQDGWAIAEPQRDAAACDRAHGELPLGADVPDVGAKSHGEAKPAE